MTEPLKDALIYNSSTKWVFCLREFIEDPYLKALNNFTTFDETLEKIRQLKHVRVIMEWYE